MIKKVINICNLIGNTLDSRDEASKLFAYLTDNSKQFSSFILDFEGVDFMSRSFADEFHKLKLKWCNENNALIEIDNPSIQIMDILQAVSKTQMSRELKNEERKVLSFTNSEQLYDFLLSF